MPGSLEQVQLLLRRFASREISLAEFQDEFVPFAWTIKQDDEAFDLVGEVELRLAEYTSGHWTRENIEEHLDSLAGTANTSRRSA